MKKKTTFGFLTLTVAALVLAGCRRGSSSEPLPEDKKYTYSTTISGSPRNWSSHEWETNTDSLIPGYAEMGLYDFIINDDLDGYEIIPEMADGEPVDVSSTLTPAERTRFGVGAGEEGLKWEINLNPNAKWDDGTPINADDYLWSMEQLLKPEMLNRRADSYYQGTLALGNARAFRYGGTEDYIPIGDDSKASVDDKEYVSLFVYLEEFEGSIFDYVDAYGAGLFPTLVDAVDSGDFGVAGGPVVYVEITNENEAEITALLEEFLAPFEELLEDLRDELVFKKVGVNVAFDFHSENRAVGILKSGEYQITLLLAAPITEFFLKYNLSGNWIVKKDIYNAGKTVVNGIEKTTYGTSLDTYASFGPYKLTHYQKDKLITLTKNEHWYGYSDGKHVGQFQTTDIRVQIVPEHATSLAMFERGEIDDIDLEAADLDKYKNSSNLLYTPESYTRKVTMSTDWVSLQSRQSEGVNKTILTNIKFREAFSWALDRLNFTQTLTSGSMPYLAPINGLYVSDPETGVAYRNTDQGKSVISSIFGDNETGYNLTKARTLLTEAYNEELASTKEGSLKEGDTVRLTFWVYGEGQIYTQYAQFLDDALKIAAEGTPLEGKIEVDKRVDEDYPDRMMAGEADMCFSTWGGATMDPFGIMEVYTKDSLKYEYGFHPDVEELTLTINGVEETRTWVEWEFELNDGAGKYHGTKADVEVRLDVLAGMEKALIEKWLFVSVYAFSNASMFSHKIKQATLEYVNLVGYGGIRFMTYNFDDAAWTAYLKANTLDYTK